ncbi:deoxycytidine triphosphate deaminase [Bartonella bacilliformis Peru38]|nr:2'-deoxycytidine 5'-triphosphate deaminase [Bartonella bacilliformis]AMG86365.1 2'-deoxycytidine 5'-triphosphate deaminase [Bartonella bacilliformis]EKS43089.1 2'-deoxycytidine 5'-triphosphate deaminase [Bartonella bacilliformis INS]EYS89030.1 deoxycytidine triphosphate deaminase [Bartonella bacilliformis San Pedro600-02]EYS95732.1 deoxycytidine triphosphate deaminase [Bartonella bacilliformis Peru-18]KEG15941.1 deoxycytidine triphosphate deaminase [Bartonella bacilliformis CUSCO5]
MMRTNGILADSDIKALIDNGVLQSISTFDTDQIQPASLDLRLGNKAYRVRASFMPGPDTQVFDKLERLKLHEFDLRDGAVLETGCVYIVPLLESLALPQMLAAVANPKSSTGRLDIFTRVITDNAQEFDKIGAGYHGQLYLEISPRTFPILVRTGSRLSQLRFRKGKSCLNEVELYTLHKNETLISDDVPNISDGGVALSINLKGDKNGFVGYRGKRHTSVIDVDKRAVANVLDFWEPLYDHGQKELVLDPDEFYILASREAIHIPPLYAAEMTPFDPLVGEFRVHYAGFFDPGFGHMEAGGKGARVVLEVRNHEVPFILEHGQIIGRLVYEHMLNRPSALYGHDIGSHYQAQGLKLSKHFK